MANTLKKATGTATIIGATIYTAAVGETAVVIGLRVVNIDPNNNHNVTVNVAGVQVCGDDLPLPIGGGYELTEGAKLVLESGDSIVVEADADSSVEVYVSYLSIT